MEGLVEESDAFDEGSGLDAARKVEHDKIAAHGTLTLMLKAKGSRSAA